MVLSLVVFSQRPELYSRKSLLLFSKSRRQAENLASVLGCRNFPSQFRRSAHVCLISWALLLAGTPSA